MIPERGDLVSARFQPSCITAPSEFSIWTIIFVYGAIHTIDFVNATGDIFYIPNQSIPFASLSHRILSLWG